MKRMLALLLALACAFSLTGCHSREELQAMRRQLDYANGVKDFDLPHPLATGSGVTLDEQEIYSDSNLTVTALGIYEAEGYYRIPLTLRNTGSYEIDWYHDTDFCVNGWQTYAWIDVDSRSVISGGMDLITFQIDKDGLSQVVTPGELKGALQYYVDDDSSYVGRTVPIELTTSAGAGENKPFDVQELVWSEDGLSLYLTGMRSSSYDLVFSFYLDNQSGDGCYFDVNEDSISLNGSEESLLSGWGYASLSGAGKKGFDLRLDWDELEALGIDRSTPLRTLSFTATVSLDNDWENYVPITADLTALKN